MPVYYKALSITFDIVKGLGVILTLFRLGFRLKIQRFWWEDLWAAVASLCAVVSGISALAAFGTSKCFQSRKPEVDSTDHPTTDHHEPSVIADKINAYMFTSIVWSVRMSLIFSIVRITPSQSLLRRMTLAAAAYCFISWAITIGLQTWWCMDHTQILPGKVRPSCVISRSIAIFQVTTNCVADAMTVIFSLKLLWRVKLPRRQRRMILSLFLASRFLCLFSLAHSIAQLETVQSVQEILADLQLGAFLIVCNLLVVVTYVYRVFTRTPDQELPSEPANSPADDDFTTPAPGPRTTQTLTVVDLDACQSVTPTTSASEPESAFCRSSVHFHSSDW